jgi:hypothetical protein
MTFLERLKLAKGSLIKARREYMKERRWQAEDWYRHWHDLADEVEQAAKSFVAATIRGGV